MSTVLLVFHVMVSVALVIVILLQRSSSDGLGGLGGGGNALLSGRASANLLTRTTGVLATLFILNSLTLATIASRSSDRTSIIEHIENNGKGEEQAPAGEKKTDDTAPSVPIAQ